MLHGTSHCMTRLRKISRRLDPSNYSPSTVKAIQREKARWNIFFETRDELDYSASTRIRSLHRNIEKSVRVCTSIYMYVNVTKYVLRENMEI